jgi:FdhE protein
MTREAWLRTHPFLAPVARVLDRVDAALNGIESSAPSLPSWDDCFADYCEGIPLLRSAGAFDLEPAGKIVCTLASRLAAGKIDDPLTAGARTLDAELGDPRAAQRVADWLLGDSDQTFSSPGLLRHLAWTVTARWLHPVVDAFARWRDEERWMRRYCPTCGALPAMAWLVGVDPGHKRFLACGCCGTRWRYRRTACPFCEHESHRLGVVTVQSEPGFRIDWCESCRGYLKAWQGQGDAGFFLADWTTLHLDVAAHDRGFVRMAASLYDLDGLLPVPSPPAP